MDKRRKITANKSRLFWERGSAFSTRTHSRLCYRCVAFLAAPIGFNLLAQVTTLPNPFVMERRVAIRPVASSTRHAPARCAQDRYAAAAYGCRSAERRVGNGCLIG